MMPFMLVVIIMSMIYLFFFTDHLEIKWDKFSQFFVFICFIMMVRHAITGGKEPGLAPVYPWEYTLVWWEDLIFSFPILLAMNKWGKNKYTVIFAIFLSLSFGYGHIYHGYMGAVISCMYPYFISYRYSKKTSLGTVMACHVAYDLMLFYSVGILN